VRRRAQGRLVDLRPEQIALARPPLARERGDAELGRPPLRLELRRLAQRRLALRLGLAQPQPEIRLVEPREDVAGAHAIALLDGRYLGDDAADARDDVDPLPRVQREGARDAQVPREEKGRREEDTARAEREREPPPRDLTQPPAAATDG